MGENSEQNSLSFRLQAGDSVKPEELKALIDGGTKESESILVNYLAQDPGRLPLLMRLMHPEWFGDKRFREAMKISIELQNALFANEFTPQLVLERMRTLKID